MIDQAEQLGQQLSLSSACQALGACLAAVCTGPASPGSPAKAKASLERG